MHLLSMVTSSGNVLQTQESVQKVIDDQLKVKGPSGYKLRHKQLKGPFQDLLCPSQVLEVLVH